MAVVCASMGRRKKVSAARVIAQQTREPLQAFSQRSRHGNQSIFAKLALINGQHAGIKIYVLEAKTNGFSHTQTASV
jgi:hypothetical protein